MRSTPGLHRTLGRVALLTLAITSPLVAQRPTSATTSAALRGPAPPLAAVPEAWAIDETTTGQPVVWASPTQLPPDAGVYHAVFELVLVEVGIEFAGIPFGQVDVTDQIPDEQRVVVADVFGPAPLVLFDNSIVSPEPPEPPAVAADLFIGLDATGSATFAATNVILGTVDVDLGFPFGVVSADITSIRIVGGLTVSARQWFPLSQVAPAVGVSLPIAPVVARFKEGSGLA